MRHVALRGKDLHSPTNEIIENNTGNTIPALKVVSLDGHGVKYPQVKMANPNLFLNFGVTYENIETGKTGLVCCFGFMYGVDTSSFSEGDILYSDANGNLTTNVLETQIATVVKSSVEGVLRVSTLDVTVEKNFWKINGNVNTDPNVNFIGTTDNQPLIIKTSNQFKAIIDQNGRLGLGESAPSRHFHLKSHEGYPGSGLQVETFAMESNSTSFNPVYQIFIPNPSIVRVEVTVIARQQIGGKRAMFKRTGLFYREGGNVQIEGDTWISTETVKNDNLFDIGYTKGVSTLDINVKNAENSTTKWTGHITLEFLV
jgi:hypothetical protein